MQEQTTDEKIICIETVRGAYGEVPYLFEVDQAEFARQLFERKERQRIVITSQPKSMAAQQVLEELELLPIDQPDHKDMQPRNMPLCFLHMSIMPLADGRTVLLIPLLYEGHEKRDSERHYAAWYQPKGGRQLKQSEFYHLLEAEGAAPEPIAPPHRPATGPMSDNLRVA